MLAVTVLADARPSVAAAFPTEAEQSRAHQLPDVVISATATQHTTADAPASVTVVGREELSRRPIQNLTDVLRDVPGVAINGAGLTRRGVSIRACPANTPSSWSMDVG